MKKVIISVSIVLVIIIGITSMIAVAFGAWDITSAYADIGTATIGTDIKLTVTVDTSTKDTKQLIPKNAEIYNAAKQATEIKIGTFKVTLTSSETGVSESQLVDKVTFATSDEKVTYADGSAIEFVPSSGTGSYTWSRYFNIGIYKGTTASPVLVDNVGEYTLKLSYKSFTGVSDPKEQEFIKSFAGKQFKISFKITITGKSV